MPKYFCYPAVIKINPNNMYKIHGSKRWETIIQAIILYNNIIYVKTNKL